MEAASVTLPVTSGVREQALAVEVFDEATNCGDTASITLPAVSGVREQALNLDVIHYSLPSKVASLTLPAVGGARETAIDLDVYDLTCGPPACELGYWFTAFDSVQNNYNLSETIFQTSSYPHGFSSDYIADNGTPPGNYPNNLWGYVSKVWLYRMECEHSYTIEEQDEYWENYDPPQYSHVWGARYYHFDHHELGTGNPVGVLNWQSDPNCHYISDEPDEEDPKGVYILKGEDHVNGKRWRSLNNDGTFELVEDLTAPSLKLPDGTFRYCIEETQFERPDGQPYATFWGYSSWYEFGERSFLDIDDSITVLTNTGDVTMQVNTSNNAYPGPYVVVPSWVADSNFYENFIVVMPAEYPESLQDVPSGSAVQLSPQPATQVVNFIAQPCASFCGRHNQYGSSSPTP